MRNTHTYVTLEISAAGYDEIAAKLRAADYGHCFNSKGEIDMTGIAVVKQPEPRPQIIFKNGLNNDFDPNVRTYPAYAAPGPPITHEIVEYHACKDPNCDRFACVASSEGCSTFCCPACATGDQHTPSCDKYIVEMKSRLIPPRTPGIDKGKIWMSDDFNEELVLVPASQLKTSAVEKSEPVLAAVGCETKKEGQ